MKELVRRRLLQVAGRALRRTPAAPRGLPQRVVVLRPDHLGDLLLTAPALRLLRTRLPESHISLLVGPWNREAASHIPYVNDVLTLDYPWFDRQPKGALWAPYFQLRQEAARLHRAAFDLALIMRHDFWWGAWLAAAAGIPQRAGYDLPEVAPFLTTALHYASGLHETEQCLRLVQAAAPSEDSAIHATDGLDFVPTPDEQAFAERWLQEHGLVGAIVALHPGAGAPVKQWPSERFGMLAQQLAADHRVGIVVTGDTHEAALVQKVVASSEAAHAVPLVGASIGQVAAVLQRCALAVGGDSGILHLAAAVGTPTVRLYGSVDSQRFGPWGAPEQHQILRSELACVPCNRLDFPTEELPYHPCLRSITTDAVLQSVGAMLSPVAAAL